MMDRWDWLDEDLRAGGPVVALKNEKDWDEEDDWEEDDDEDEEDWDDEDDEEDDEDWDEWEEEDDTGLSPRRSTRPYWE
jgi:hypothetical protein